MAQPTARGVHIDRVLSQVSLAYMQQANFVADKVFPVVTVRHQSDKYRIWPKNAWFRDEAQRRGPGTESSGGGFELSNAPYHCDVWAHHYDVADQIRDNADDGVNLDTAATEWVSQILKIRQEVEFASTYMVTSVWGNTITGVAAAPGANQTIQWDQYASSDPRSDIKTARQAIRLDTGMVPNTMLIGSQVFDALQDHPDIVDRIKYTSLDSVTPELLAKVFNVDRVIVAESVKATNLEGETEAYGDIIGKVCWIGYVAPNPGLMTPSAGYIFAWRGAGNRGFGENVAIKRFRMEHLESDRVEGQIAFDAKIVAADLGYIFLSIVS